METKKKIINDNEIGDYIIKNGEFPFELFGVNKEDTITSSLEDRKNYEFTDPISKKMIKVNCFEGMKPGVNWLVVTIITPKEINQYTYTKRSFRVDHKNVVEIERVIKDGRDISIFDNQEDIDSEKRKKLFMDFDFAVDVRYSKRIERERDDENIVEIDYCIPGSGTISHAYERLKLTAKDDNSLDSIGGLDRDKIIRKISKAKKADKIRRKRRESILEIRNYDLCGRNKRFLDFVKSGITLDETLAAVYSFVENLPFSMDPTHKSFIPGEAFFNEPTDLKQLNHKGFDDKEHRTIFIGMRNWNDTRKSSCTIALCAFFQQMLLSGKKAYTVSEIINFMKKNKIILPVNLFQNVEDKKYVEDRNTLFQSIAESMAEKYKMVIKGSRGERNDALSSVCNDILKSQSRYGIKVDLQTYYNSKNVSSSYLSIDFMPGSTIQRMERYDRKTIDNVLNVLNRIYYNRRKVSLNSKRMYMVRIAAQLLGDMNYAICLVDNYYHFDIREVDIPSKSNTTEKSKRKARKINRGK